MIRARDYGEMNLVYCKNILCPQIPALKSSEFPDPGCVKQQAGHLAGVLQS
jgi:hypothetical protein